MNTRRENSQRVSFAREFQASAVMQNSRATDTILDMGHLLILLQK